MTTLQPLKMHAIATRTHNIQASKLNTFVANRDNGPNYTKNPETKGYKVKQFSPVPESGGDGDTKKIKG